jgi:DUF917 family protein
MSDLTLTRNDIEPLLEGLAIRGTGGGGNPSWGRLILENDLAHGRSWHILSLQDVPDNWTVVCTAAIGSVKAIDIIGFEAVLSDWENRYFPLQTITLYMQELLKRHIDAVVAFEVGGLNSPIVLTLAARMGIPVIDADALGRSAPETHLTSWHGLGVDITPMVIADSEGNIITVSKAVDPTYVDKVGRWMVTQGGYLGADVQHPMSGKVLKETSVPGTFTDSLKLGRSVFEARQHGENPIIRVASLQGALKILNARICMMHEEEWMGFYFTEVELIGIGKDAGRSIRLVIKNEAMVCYLDGKPITIFPDSIYMLEPGTGRGLMSVELKPDLELVILCAPAHPRLRAAAVTEAGRKAFNPVRFGQHQLEFKSIEELIGLKSNI